MVVPKGGQRPKIYLNSSQARLLECLWARSRGNQPVTDAATKVGCSISLLLTWRKRGAVPLQHTGGVARAMKVPIAALNYEEVSWMLGAQPTWEKIVKMCKFMKVEEDYILAGKHPKKFKQIEEVMK